jgi:hypothetical protein
MEMSRLSRLVDSSLRSNDRSGSLRDCFEYVLILKGEHKGMICAAQVFPLGITDVASRNVGYGGIAWSFDLGIVMK